MIIDSRYKVIEELGSGLWGIVYKVRDIRTEKISALKLFKHLDTKSLYERFSAEQMHHITKIKHANLVPVLDFGNFGKHVYYLREYAEGSTLTDFKFNITNLEILYDIIVQICYGLNALHSQNIVHQDLKPANVVYSIKENRVYVQVMDYGFTKIDLEKKQQLLSSTLPYVAPEIYLEKKSELRSDFYSLGVLLYKITTGILPYTIEQISSFITGDSYNLFPKFPRELNPEIPDGLEKLILKLLEKYPEDRFKDSQEIISYINKIQMKQYPFSLKWSIVNNIKFSDYIIREDYSHNLLEYIPIIKECNGKLVVVIGGKGLGKTGILQLFRYHLLTDEFFIFDYECSYSHKDPFFALMKEFITYIRNNDKLKKDITNISSKLKEYLYKSEEVATEKVQSKEELNQDFITAANFITHLSEEKPLIFMIRAGQYLEPVVIDFMNFISRSLTDLPVLIILAINDPRKIEGLIHPVQMKIEPLDLEQTKMYITKLLKQVPPDDFLNGLWNRSNGNPLFIEQILIDLTEKRKIWRNEVFNFNFNFKNYKLPQELLHSVYLRMAHLSEINYKYLQDLSFVNTSLSKSLIKYVLDINDKELFFLIKDGINNEILMEKGDYYLFSFEESIDRFQKETDKKIKSHISRKVIDYFDDKTITMIPILKGIVMHARFIRDYKSVRRFSLGIVGRYSQLNNHQEAFNELCSILELDFGGSYKPLKSEYIHDIMLLIKKSEWGVEKNISEALKKSVRKMPDIAEKHLLIGVFYQIMEKYRIALARFVKASNLAITGRTKAMTLLKMAETYNAKNDILDLGITIEALETIQLPEEYQVKFVSLKALFLGLSGHLEEAINLIEDVLPKIQTGNDADFFCNLGTLHNSLAYLYHKKKMLAEAEKNFLTAQKLWERINLVRKLGTVYNNLGDVSLVQGYTKAALGFFEKALETCRLTDSKKIRVLSLLNFGETNIKLGRFVEAEDFLTRALELTESLESKPFYSSIIYNFAIAKSKINNFGYYIDFIRDHVPEILSGNLKTITPLTKTYFYFLYNIGAYNTIEKLLKKYETLFLESREYEFYYQVKGFVAIKRKKFDEALPIIERAFEYSQKNKSVYAQAINYIRFSECYLGTGEVKKAIEMCDQAKKICEQYDYNYWGIVSELRKIKAQLSNDKVSLRVLIRELLVILEYVRENNLFFLEIEALETMVQIYSHLKIFKQASEYFTEYKKVLKSSAKGLNEKHKKVFFQKYNYNLKNFAELKTVKIVQRTIEVTEKWQEELYDILKIKEADRMKFFIEKAFANLLSPDLFAIVLNEEIQTRSEPFLKVNIDTGKLYSSKYLNSISKAIDRNVVVKRVINSCHTLFIPLRIKAAKVGCLILADRGELLFQDFELNIIQNLRLHLSSLLIRIREFSQLNRDLELMTKLIEINQQFFSYIDLENLEQEIVSFALDFTKGKRGFLIKRDKYQNFVYKVALDDSSHLLKNYSFISKGILGEVMKTKEPLFIMNAKDDEMLKSFIDFKSDKLSVYCAPILADGEVYGLIYIDNYTAPESTIFINKEFMRLMLIQISISISNAQQYESLKKKNIEIRTLDKLKNDFINIVSHELKTPLVTLKGYITRLSKEDFPDKICEQLANIDNSVAKLYSTTDSIINHNKYILVKELKKNPVAVQDILQVIVDEAKEVSQKRHMIIKMEIEDNLPLLPIDWESFKLMINNIVMNAIRFTKDFGTIVIGARRSTFQQEEIDGEEAIVFYVQDNGIGIPKIELDKIFQTFYELSEIYSHSSGTVEFKSSGLGLGLSTSGLIVKLHDGKIWINSKEGEGTTVFMVVPIQKGEGDL
jgi:signal transduction histidine kinase/tetratricopeptide (TPR) repeat protein/tRNA A-37 threonylcarbamoyl transferase component Bud32